jgi:hypothetical protein
MSEIFPRAKEANARNGWTLNFDYMKRVQDKIDDNIDPEADTSLEAIEAVLLAVEKVGMK